VIVAYYKGQTLLHRLNPLSKLSAVLAGCTALFLIGSVKFTMVAPLVVAAFAIVTGTGGVLRLAGSRFVSVLGLWLILVNAVLTPTGKILVSIPFYLFCQWPDKVLMFVSLTIVALLLLEKTAGWTPLPAWAGNSPNQGMSDETHQQLSCSRRAISVLTDDLLYFAGRGQKN
jgi:energy-coupling factor transporter transmembrane protein EcfT